MLHSVAPGVGFSILQLPSERQDIDLLKRILDSMIKYVSSCFRYFVQNVAFETNYTVFVKDLTCYGLPL